MKDWEHAVEILQGLKNDDPIESMAGERIELVESSDDEEMDLTSEFTSPSSSCDRTSVLNPRNRPAQRNESPRNGYALVVEIPIYTLVHSTHDNITVNNDTDNNGCSKSQKHLTRDDEVLSMNHQSVNNATTQRPSLRNVELLMDMFGSYAPTLQTTTNKNMEWESAIDGNTLHGHANTGNENFSSISYGLKTIAHDAMQQAPIKSVT